MCPPLGRALVLLAAAACSRPTSPTAPGNASARGGAPAVTVSRVAPAPEPPREPPPPLARCLPREPLASPGVLAEEAAEALVAGRPERALVCAEEAVRLSPRLVAALAARAGALAAQGRLEPARLAWARALAVAPDDPASLLGSAELHVRRLGPARDALEIGLEYALRGVRAAASRKDAVLAARLELVAGMAQNDLGRSQLALGHLDRAVAALPSDPDVVYERGVALYELCRFREAQRAFERALALAPDDPWTLHQLGLLAERRGDLERATALLQRARELSPDDFRGDLPVDAEAFRAEVAVVLAALPDEERRAAATVPVEIADLPDAADLLAVDPPLSPTILGLFRGPADDEPCTAADGPRCRSIVLYRKNLLRFARDRQELSEQVRVTLLHELGHLRGEDDDELRARGLE
jgi:tetratricopeptide (TPR) repeat protein